MASATATAKLDRELLTELTNHQGSRSLTIIMPTERSGSKVQGNSLRFKNLVHQAFDRFTAQGEPQGDLKRTMEPLFAKIRDDNFWQHQTEALAVFFCQGEEKSVALHHPVEAMTYVSDHYYIKPLALELNSKSGQLVLAMSWDRARLFMADGLTVEEIENDLFPVEFSEIVLPADAEKQLQYRTHRSQGNSQGDAMYHGQGGGERTIEADRHRFLSEAGKRLQSFMQPAKRPVWVMATDEVAGHFGENTKFVPAGLIRTSPEQLSSSEIAEKIKSQLSSCTGNAVSDELRDALGLAVSQSRGSHDVNEIIDAAERGRVERLFVDPQRQFYGVWQSLEQRFDPDYNGQNCELTNVAVIKTLQTGGELIAASRDLLGNSPLAAIYRY